jgi:hypothetical protein
MLSACDDTRCCPAYNTLHTPLCAGGVPSLSCPALHLQRHAMGRLSQLTPCIRSLSRHAPCLFTTLSSRLPGSVSLKPRILITPSSSRPAGRHVPCWGLQHSASRCNFIYGSLRSLILMLITRHYFLQFGFWLSDYLDEVWIVDYFTVLPCYTCMALSELLGNRQITCSLLDHVGFVL